MAILGIVATIAFAAPLAAADASERQERAQQSRDSMQERATGQSGPSSVQTINQLRSSSKIIGMDILSATGDKVAQVDDLFIDMESGRILAVVASTGGLLGTGGDRSLMSAEDVRFDAEKEHLRTDLTKEQLKSTPPFRKGDTPEFHNVRPLGESARARRQSESSGAVRRQSDERARNPETIGASQQSGARRGETEVTRQSEAARTRADSSGAANQRDADGRQMRSATTSMAATDLVGMDVHNRAGDKVGAIDKLYLDLEGGQVIGVVVSTGGFLGMGAHHNVLALNELDYNAGEETVHVNLSRAQLRSAPTYKEGDSSWHAAVRERSERIAALRVTTGTPSRTAQSDSNSPTAFSQGNSSTETKMTADIRRAIRDSDNMSTRANNVTIITQEDKVLLRGDVDSEREKMAIEALARGKAGVENVTSELVVRTR